MKFAGYLLLIVLCGFVLRVWNLSAQSLDMDEYGEIQVRSMTYVEAATRPESMPPLYPVLLKSWLAICPGDPNVAGRWLSMAIGVATVALVGVMWARCFGATLALVASGLLAISPLHVFYSQHTRGYVLLFFWAALVMAALVSAVKSERKFDWALFVVGSLGGLYTHYYFAIFWAVLCVVVGWSAYGWKFGRQWWMACVAVGLLSLPLLGFVQSDLSFQKHLREARPMGVGAFGYTYLSMATGFSIGPAKTELQQMPIRDALVAGAPISAVVGSIYLILGVYGIGYLLQRNQVLFVFVLIFVPVLLVGLLGQLTGVTYNPRFVVWSLLPLLLLLAAGAIQGRRSWVVRVASIGLVMVSALAIYNRHSDARYQKVDVRAAGNYLVEQDLQKAPLFVVPGYMAELIAHYLPSEWKTLQVADLEHTARVEDSSEDVEKAMKVMESQLPVAGQYWFFYSRAFHGDPHGELLSRLKEEWKLAEKQEYAGVVLFQGDVADVSGSKSP